MRFIFGDTPAQHQELESWVLSVPSSWTKGIAPGATSPALTQRCGQAVSQHYDQQRSQAFAQAHASVASGGDYDAGHYQMEGASIWTIAPEELVRRPWLGPRRLFYVLDKRGRMREGTETDAPSLAPLTEFEDHMFAGWRAEEVESWGPSADSYARAMKHTDTTDDLALLGEAAAGWVRANAKLGRIEETVRAGTESIATLEARGVDAAGMLLVNVRLGEGLLDDKPHLAALAFARAQAALSADDPRALDLAGSRGLALLRCAEFAEAGVVLRSAVAAFERLPPEHRAASYAQAQHNLALTLEYEGHLADAQERVTAAIDLHTRSGSDMLAASSRLTLARILVRAGKVAEGTALLAEIRPLLVAESVAEGLAEWIQALIDDAAEAESSEVRGCFDRARQLLSSCNVWLVWLAEDRARLLD